MIRIIDDGAPQAGNWGFIVGMHGSGVSLAEQIVNGHPKARALARGVMLGYLDILRRDLVEVDTFWQINNLRMVETYLDPGALAERLGLELDDLETDVPGWPASLLRSFFEGLRGWTRAADGEPPLVLLESCCRYAHDMTTIQSVFPGSSVVWCLRDPWDTIASSADNKRQLGMLATLDDDELLAQEAGIIAQQCRRYIEHRDTYGSQVVTFRFEELLSSPADTAAAFLEKLGLDPADPGRRSLELSPAAEDKVLSSRSGPYAEHLHAIRRRLMDGETLGLSWLTSTDVDALFEAYPDEGSGW